MKRNLLSLVLLAMIALSVNAQVIAEIDWTQRSEYLDLWYSDLATVSVEQGTGLIIDCLSDGTGKYWEPMVPMIGHIDEINEGGQYLVKFTAQSPVDGKLRLDFCSWDGTGATLSKIIDVTTGIHEYNVDFEDYPTKCTDAQIFYQCGKLPGRHIIKNVQLMIKEKIYDPLDICYNYVAKGKIAEVINNPDKKYYGKVEIPSKVIHDGIEYTVTKINDNTFKGCSGLTSVTIPNSVTSIGESAFEDCI